MYIGNSGSSTPAASVVLDGGRGRRVGGGGGGVGARLGVFLEEKAPAYFPLKTYHLKCLIAYYKK